MKKAHNFSANKQSPLLPNLEPQPMELLVPSVEKDVVGNKSHQCTLCCECFPEEEYLEIHLKENHNVVEKARKFDIPTPLNVLPITPTIKTTFKCFICPNSFYNEGEWEEHELATHKHSCKMCDETFRTNVELSEHDTLCTNKLSRTILSVVKLMCLKILLKMQLSSLKLLNPMLNPVLLKIPLA